MSTDLPFTVVDTESGFEIHVDPEVIAQALRSAGWTVFAPLSPDDVEEVLALMEQPVQDALMSEAEAFGARRDLSDNAWPVQESWPDTDLSRSMVPEPADRPGRHRTGDHATSVAGARAVAFRAGSQTCRMLAVYGSTVKDGLTDEDAAEEGGLTGCWWKRCGELRQDGLIEQVFDDAGNAVTRPGRAGVPRIVCRITPAGRTYLARLDMAVR